MARGRIDWYSANQGHGFIIPEDGGPKAFVRREDVAVGEEEYLENNDEVTYEAIGGAEGPEARNVART